MTHHPLIIAHRGASGHAPENTMAAFRLAVEQSADWIELDVHQTADGGLVVLHDFTLRRTAGDPRPVRELTLKQIKDLDIGSWWDGSYRSERVPTLDEVLGFAAGRLRVFIEIKRGSPFYSGIERRVLETIARHRAGDRVAISSFDIAALNTLRGLDSGIPLGLLTRKTRPRDILNAAESLTAHSIHISTHRFTKTILTRAHSAGLPVYVYTVNRPSLMKRYLAMGADGLFTNYPDRLRDLLGNSPALK
ncbi:MAG TPA: glycerophosphodiester phosphodiesterase family protein [Nitrospiria bacterium]|jgi:glycerophosphoryl diester phosphodiesterase|nr:glycerophosphodiester phosphodiesterase family protein [Nitrospiria bacterium]